MLLICFIFYLDFIREIIDILKGGNIANVGEISTEIVDLPFLYAKNTRKFIDDCSSSLNNHIKNLKKRWNKWSMNIKNYVMYGHKVEWFEDSDSAHAWTYEEASNSIAWF